MTVSSLLTQFYKENNLPKDGGVAKDTFKMTVLGITLKLPNPKFRKNVIHIHDIQHILNKCDTSWKGEGFIAGWEISTGFWKYFPICIFSIFAMGYSLWVYPKAVFDGFKKGLGDIGIIDLKVSKDKLMTMAYSDLVRITRKVNPTKMGVFQWINFLFWSIVSQIIFLFPLIIIAVIWLLK